MRNVEVEVNERRYNGDGCERRDLVEVPVSRLSVILGRDRG